MKNLAKAILQRAGLFPVARAAYRGLNPRIRHELLKDRALYSQFIKRGDLVFDVGVNLGQKTETFLGCGAKVIGIEPNPRCTPTLNRLFGSNPNFVLVQEAVGAEEGILELHFTGTDSTASLRADWGEKRAMPNIESMPVPVTTLDRLIDRFGVPAFCKIDVEGFEEEVLKGLSTPLPMVTLEWHGDEIDALCLCLDRLSSLTPIEVNFIPINEQHFVFSRWSSPKEVRFDRLPYRGDCFARLVSRSFEGGHQ